MSSIAGGVCASSDVGGRTLIAAGQDFQPLLAQTLDDAIALTHAGFGNIQLRDRDRGVLVIVAQLGFRRPFLDHFAEVTDSDGSVCGRAAGEGERVVVSDVELDPAFERHRAIAAETGFRAVQSTPLFDRTGAPLGMLSTHFRSPRSFSERELLMTDLCAKRAADILDAALMRPAKRMICEDCAMRSNGDRLGWIGVQLLRRPAAGPPLLLTYCPGCARQFVPAEIVWRA